MLRKSRRQPEQTRESTHQWIGGQRTMRQLQSAFFVLLVACAGCLPGRAFARVDSDVGSELSQIQQLIQNGHKVEALGRVRQALTHSPNEPNLYNFLGVLEAQASNYLAAEASFRRAIELGPRLTTAYFNLGRLYQENPGKDSQALSKAVEIYQALLSHQPNSAEARYQCARLLCLQGKFKDTLSHLSRLPAADQRVSHVLIISLTANAALGRQALARETASRLLSNPGLTEADLLPFLFLLSKHGQRSTGVSLLRQLDQRSNLSSDGYRELGLLYEDADQLPDAKRMLERAVQSSKPSTSLLLDLARVSHKQKDPQAALGYLAHARDLNSDDPQIHYLFGAICTELDLSEDAYESFKKAVQLDGQNADYNFAAGAVALQRRAASESISYLTKYRGQRPQDPRGHLALGAAYYQAGQLDDAQRELRLACGNSETASAAHYYLGRAALQTDNFEMAARELESALEANPKNLDAAAELGLVRLRTKNYRLAEQTLANVLIKDPDHYKANLHLLNLYQRTRDARTEEQEQRFEQVRKRRSDREQSLLRRVEFIK
jgi:tetratricopeptide (TPR) repeat protein